MEVYCCLQCVHRRVLKVAKNKLGVNMNKNDNNTFGKLVKELRLQLDLTQEELANKSGCATISIRRIEAGTLRPSTQLAEQLAIMLDVHEDEQEAFTKLARGLPATNGHAIEKYEPEPLLPSSVEALKLDGRSWRQTEYLLTFLPLIFTAIVFILNPNYLLTLLALEPPFVVVNVLPLGWLVFAMVFALMVASKFILQYGRSEAKTRQRSQLYRTGLNGFVLIFMTFPALLLVLLAPALFQVMRSGVFDPK